MVSRGRVVVADPQAQMGGVSAGQKLSTALGLLPALAVFERSATQETQALIHLANWAGRFTPTVCLVPPTTLLLEIGGCLRLFGGVEAIVKGVRCGCSDQEFTPGWAVAPTPLGARWLAQSGGAVNYPDLPSLQLALAELPCAVTGWPEDIQARLQAFGLQRLGDLRRLPAAALRQRIGPGPIDELLRAWGELPDPQRSFIFPESFASELTLPGRVEHAEALVFAGQRLFAALAGWLAARQSQVRSCRLCLRHDAVSTSELALHFAEPSADAERFLRLLREHLGRLHLRAPVEAVHLLADEVVATPAASGQLFSQAMAGEGALACLERLRARLGEQAVQGLIVQADHRPECATVTRQAIAEIGAKSMSTAAVSCLPPGQRPLWLLPTPQALAERAGGPQWHGPLKLLSRPERLESGWWDQGEQAATGDVRRDYFVARNPQGQWAWIFRSAEGWFLHGLFA